MGRSMKWFSIVDRGPFVLSKEGWAHVERGNEGQKTWAHHRFHGKSTERGTSKSVLRASQGIGGRGTT